MITDKNITKLILLGYTTVMLLETEEIVWNYNFSEYVIINI